jgi:hypothetical protein
MALGIRDGISDAKQGKPPYFIRILFTSEPTLFVQKIGLKSIATPLAAGIVLDMILQWIIFKQSFFASSAHSGNDFGCASIFHCSRPEQSHRPTMVRSGQSKNVAVLAGEERE